jgi:hypothetical protein
MTRGVESPQFPASSDGRVRSIGVVAWSEWSAQALPDVHARSGWQHALGPQQAICDAAAPAGSGKCAANISDARARAVIRRRSVRYMSGV